MEWTELGKLANIETGKLNANAADEGGKYPFFTCADEISRINDYKYDKECILIAGDGNLNVKYYSGKFNAYQNSQHNVFILLYEYIYGQIKRIVYRWGN